MKRKLFCLLTLLLTVCSGAWAATAISCSAYLTATSGTATTSGCTLKYYSDEGSVGTLPACGTVDNSGSKTVNAFTYYYAKMNNDKNYYEITCSSNGETKFQAGDVITVYLYSNGTTVSYKVGKTPKTDVTLSGQTKSTIIASPHTLTAAEIESNGTVRIYRNSSNTWIAGFTVTGTHKTAATLTFETASGSADIAEGTSFSLPTLTKTPVDATVTYTSSDEGVATVNETSGAVTLVHAGKTTITASFAGNSEYAAAQATFELTVNNTAKATITVTYDITGVTGVVGTAPASFSIDEDETFPIPVNKTLYVDGKTLTGWNDGISTYAIGESVTAPATDMTLTPVFTSNDASAYLGHNASTATWTFKTSEGAPSWALQGYGTETIETYVVQSTIGGNTIDVLMTMDATNGKINNKSSNVWTQMNTNTKLTVPVTEDAVVQVYVYSSAAALTFDGNSGDFDSTNKIYSYTATAKGNVDIVFTGDDYASKVVVSYPSENAVYNLTEDNTEILLTKPNIEGNDYLAVDPTDKWSGNKTYGDYSGNFFNMSSGRTLTINVKGASSFELMVQDGTGGRGYSVKVGDNEAQNITHSATKGVESSGVFAIADPSDATTIQVSGTGESVYPVAIVFNPTVAVTGNAYNWITFCNGSALDFTGSDVTAYVVTGTSGTALKKTEVTDVAAGTPLMINATAGTHYVKKAATGTDYSATNCLKQGEGAAVAAEDGKSRYILTLRDEKAAFAIIDNEYSPTVPSNKAYLEIEDGGAARSFFFLDDEGETTSLNEVRGLKADVRGDFYNLNGQRVAQPTKGLYIVNGRKVVIK